MKNNLSVPSKICWCIALASMVGTEVMSSTTGFQTGKDVLLLLSYRIVAISSTESGRGTDGEDVRIVTEEDASS